MIRPKGLSKPRIGIVQFLGSNCDQDCFEAFSRHFDIQLTPIWHTQTELGPLDGLIIPGGFSYGDFLRAGALASHTRIMRSVKEFADKGGAILGICNGFQILTETRILPGALLKNDSGQFVCKYVDLTVAKGQSGYHRSLAGRTLRIPVAHGEGRYYVDAQTLTRLEQNGQLLFHYVDNPNGSLANVAGVVSDNGRVLGLMPHPERATDVLCGGSDDGLLICRAFLEACL